MGNDNALFATAKTPELAICCDIGIENTEESIRKERRIRKCQHNWSKLVMGSEFSSNQNRILRKETFLGFLNNEECFIYDLFTYNI